MDAVKPLYKIGDLFIIQSDGEMNNEIVKITDRVRDLDGYWRYTIAFTWKNDRCSVMQTQEQLTDNINDTKWIPLMT